MALAGLLVFFLGIERRTTREVVHNSQVAVLVDVSQSMGLNEGDGGENAKPASRLDEVVATLAEVAACRRPATESRRQRRPVRSEVQPVVSLPKTTDANGQPLESTRRQGARRRDSADISSVANDGSLPGADANGADKASVDWSAELSPQRHETRLGDALDEQLRLYRDAPLAGVVVISDGATERRHRTQRGGRSGQEAKVPIFTIGVGSTRPRRNVAVSDLLVPSRAFPGDTLNDHRLSCRPPATRPIRRRRVAAPRRGRSRPAPARRSPSQRVALGADGEIVPVSFDIEPDEPGRLSFSSASQRRRTTTTPATISARRKWKSSTARRACCCSPAGRRATINSCAISSTATRR